jgi:hypothetical protein
MNRNDRTSIKLTDLPLESVSKVFKFLEEFLKTDCLDLDVFENKIKKFNILEQYFICEYGEEYYSEQRLRLWIKDFTKHQGIDDDVLGLIRENGQNFILGIKGMKNSLRRLVADYKRKNIIFKDLAETFEEEINNYRLPLYFVPQTQENYEKRGKILAINKITFKKEVHAIFSDVFTEQEIKWFFINSFDFNTNPYPVNLLYMEVQENLDDFYNRIHQLYTSYLRFYEAEKKRYQDYYTDYTKQLEKGEIKKIAVNDKGLLIDTGETTKITDPHKNYNKPKKPFELPDFTKTDIAKILFNNFSHIREDYYQKKLKNSDYQLDTFLKSIENKIREKK